MSIPLPPHLAATGDPTVMVEVFPTGVTVHDIRAVVTQEVPDDDDAHSEFISNFTMVYFHTFFLVFFFNQKLTALAFCPSIVVCLL